MSPIMLINSRYLSLYFEKEDYSIDYTESIITNIYSTLAHTSLIEGKLTYQIISNVIYVQFITKIYC